MEQTRRHREVKARQLRAHKTPGEARDEAIEEGCEAAVRPRHLQPRRLGAPSAPDSPCREDSGERRRLEEASLGACEASCNRDHVSADGVWSRGRVRGQQGACSWGSHVEMQVCFTP